MKEDLIGYDKIIEGSMRMVIHDVLKSIEKEGLKGEHHFFIVFSTKASGVQISKALHNKFPSEMTIVLQHQFGSFRVLENHFEVTLNFAGIPEKMTIPYKSIISFADPSVNFGLKFALTEDEVQEYMEEGEESSKSGVIDTSQKIISLDDFRKNNK
jgi:hypothetical protein